MLMLSSIPKALEFRSVNCTSIYKDFDLNIFENMKSSGEISNNYPKDLLGTNVFKTLEFCW